MTDHLELAPDMVDAMKRDLVDVISRYVEVDREKIDVTFEQQDKTLAMLANIPILAVNRNGNVSPPAATNGHAPTESSPEPAALAASVPVAPAKRKRRRRKKAKPPVAAPVLLSS